MNLPVDRNPRDTALSQSAKPVAKPVIVIAGPTASGKSALAVDLAERVSGVVINADSMQVYRGLEILTPESSSMPIRCRFTADWRS